MEIIKTTFKDLQALAKCQQECFPASFAVKLGYACLHKSLQWFLVSPNRFLVHIEYEGKIVGFCGGFMPQFVGDGSKSGILHFAIKEAFYGLLKRPWLWFHSELWRFGTVFLKNRWKIFSNKKNENPTGLPADIHEYLSSVALTIICVHPAYRGAGLAKSLLLFAEDFAIKHDRKVLSLGVKQKNSSACKAYIKNGWAIDKKLGDSFVMKKYL